MTEKDLAGQEKARRRERVEQRRSPGQMTPRSENKARRQNRPGKRGGRNDWKREQQ